MLVSEISARLERAFGLGSNPLVRRRLYRRLQRLAEQRGEAVLHIIAQVASEAQAKTIKSPGQFFSYVIGRRLKESGYDFLPPGQDDVARVRRELAQDLVDRSRIDGAKEAF
jgi:hypothetical protein